MKGRGIVDAAIEATTDIEIVQRETSRGDDFGCYGCCGTINIHTLCGGIAVHMQSCNTDPGGIEFLYRCIKFAVFGVVSKPAMVQSTCALCRTVGFKVIIYLLAHRHGSIW